LSLSCFSFSVLPTFLSIALAVNNFLDFLLILSVKRSEETFGFSSPEDSLLEPYLLEEFTLTGDV
jgi:hypothetical protein